MNSGVKVTALSPVPVRTSFGYARIASANSMSTAQTREAAQCSRLAPSRRSYRINAHPFHGDRAPWLQRLTYVATSIC